MRRRLFTLCSALSLLLCVAVCVLWVFSYYTLFKLIVRSGPIRGDGTFTECATRFVVNSVNGGIGFQIYDQAPEIESWSYDASYYSITTAGPLVFERQWIAGGYPAAGVGERGPWLGFVFARDHPTQSRGGSGGLILTVPCWFVVAGTAILPIRWRWLRNRARRRNLSGRCPSCGYDLRATSARCPECGAACKAANPAGVSPAAGN
jgi:hypothetical protein